MLVVLSILLSFLLLKLLMLMVCGKNTCVIFGSWLQITAVHYLPVLPRKFRSRNMSVMSVKVLPKDSSTRQCVNSRWPS